VRAASTLARCTFVRARSRCCNDGMARRSRQSG
jgi:hypothetical protein